MGFSPQENEDEKVDQYCGEHGDEDPEIVQPETLDGEGSINPALENVSPQSVHTMGRLLDGGHTQALART